MGIKRVSLDNYDLSKYEHVFSSSDNDVYRLFNSDGSCSFLKIFSLEQILKLIKKGYSLDRSLEYSVNVQDTAIIIPSNVVINTTGLSVGFKTLGADGISLYDKFKELSKCETLNLEHLTSLYLAIYEEVKHANDKGAVFPDLLNFKNTFLSDTKQSSFKIQFIDFDGIQLGNNPSSILCSKRIYPFVQNARFNDMVYDHRSGLFTKKIDMVGLVYLYFYLLFGYNIGRLNSSICDNSWLFFSLYGIDDEKIKDMVWSSIYPHFDVRKIDYFGDKINWIADNYKLETVGKNADGTYKRRLIK